MRYFFFKYFKFSLSQFCFICLTSTLYASPAYHYELIEKDNHQVHFLAFDPKLYKIIAVKADRREAVSVLAKQWGAIAGINGGFFTHEGEPSGALKIRGEWLHFPDFPRAALGWNASDPTTAQIDRLLVRKHLHRIEALPQEDRCLFGKKRWQGYEYIVGGIPLLIKEGKKNKDHTPEKISVQSFLTEKHARTAVCIKGNQEWVWAVAAHSKDPFVSKVEGFTLSAWADFLQEQGCAQAINLDGGGSSTFVLQGKVLNYPAGDKDPSMDQYRERPVSDAILLLPLLS